MYWKEAKDVALTDIQYRDRNIAQYQKTLTQKRQEVTRAVGNMKDFLSYLETFKESHGEIASALRHKADKLMEAQDRLVTASLLLKSERTTRYNAFCDWEGWDQLDTLSQGGTIERVAAIAAPPKPATAPITVKPDARPITGHTLYPTLKLSGLY